MSGVQMMIQFFDKLAWPLVVLFCFFAMKKPLLLLIPSTKQLKYKNFEINFEKGLLSVSKEARKALPELRHDKKAWLFALAESFPNAAVLDAWEAVNDSAGALLTSMCGHYHADAGKPYKQKEDMLVDNEIIDTKIAKLFSELRQLRNKVAHAKGYAVGTVQARQYIELCYKLIDHLSTLNK